MFEFFAELEKSLLLIKNITIGFLYFTLGLLFLLTLKFGKSIIENSIFFFKSLLSIKGLHYLAKKILNFFLLLIVAIFIGYLLVKIFRILLF